MKEEDNYQIKKNLSAIETGILDKKIYTYLK